jgi:hypothetical protein
MQTFAHDLQAGQRIIGVNSAHSFRGFAQAARHLLGGRRLDPRRVDVPAVLHRRRATFSDDDLRDLAFLLCCGMKALRRGWCCGHPPTPSAPPRAVARAADELDDAAGPSVRAYAAGRGGMFWLSRVEHSAGPARRRPEDRHGRRSGH